MRPSPDQAASHQTAPAALDGVDHAMVVGLGASGLAAARLLRGARVRVTLVDDRSDHPAAEFARAEGFEVVLGRAPVDVLEASMGLVVPSPGVPEHAPVLRVAATQGIPVWSEPELALRVHPRRLLAVTGTNGKTSTTELLAGMLAADGIDAIPCGNIGRPVSEAAPAAPLDAVLVAELSSFQLRFAGRLRPEVGVVLNLAADHLDWHPDLDAYGAAKARLWEAQRDGDWAVANADDPLTLALQTRAAPANRAVFSATAPVAVGVGRDGDHLVAAVPGHTGRVVEVAALSAVGPPAPHHVANVAAAACTALLAGCRPAAVARAAAGYHPGRHRFEVVATDGRGVRYIDDSKATNVHAAAAALRAVDGAVWIAGGLSKGVDLSPLSADLGGVHDAVLLGAAAAELAEVCATADVRAHRVGSMEDAVALAATLARPGDTVLLAPACASFDQFRSYADRGERFAAAVRAVTTTAAPSSRGGRS